MNYISIDPQLDTWLDFVADLPAIFGDKATVSYDQFTGLPASVILAADLPLGSATEAYVSDATLSEWQQQRYETHTGYAEAKGWQG